MLIQIMVIKERKESLERDIAYSLALRGFELTGVEKGRDIPNEELILTILENPIISRSLSAVPYLLITQDIKHDYLISEARKRGLVNKLGYMTDIATQIFRDDKKKRRELQQVSKLLEGMMGNGEHYLESDLFEWQKDFLKKRTLRTGRKWHVYTHNKIDTYTTHFYLYYKNGKYYEERGQKRRPFKVSSRS